MDREITKLKEKIEVARRHVNRHITARESVSQKMLAEEIGISASYLSQCLNENTNKTLSQIQLRRLADVLGFDAEWVSFRNGTVEEFSAEYLRRTSVGSLSSNTVNRGGIEHFSLDLNSRRVLFGRENDFSRLLKNLQESYVYKAFAIHGLPGVGKTEFAIELATRFLYPKGNLIWVDCENDICLLYTSPSPRD